MLFRSRVYPAIDIDASGTRKEELLLAPDELSIVQRLRKALHAVDSQRAVEQLLEQLRKTNSNTELLVHLTRSTPGGA